MDASLAGLNFDTDRLRVGEWRRAIEGTGMDLVSVVVELMTSRTTEALPDSWRGDYSVERAERWIVERDAESPTLLVADRQTGAAIGLLFLFFGPANKTDADQTDYGQTDGDVRLGYLLSEAMWGEGYGSELVGGLIDWGRVRPDIATLTAGVEASNVASVRVLLKNGFALVESESDGDLTYRVDVDAGVPDE